MVRKRFKDSLNPIQNIWLIIIINIEKPDNISTCNCNAFIHRIRLTVVFLGNPADVWSTYLHSS